MQYLDKLLAQRTHFITALYANKQNVEDNRKRLNAAARQLANKHQPSILKLNGINYIAIYR